MKRLTCEMCGSTDIVKQDGLFVCQNCETKYSVEEARKMMIEGTVEVVGTVKIDHSDNLDNLVQFARDALEDGRFDDAYGYSTEALTIVSNSPEIIALQSFSVLGKEDIFTDVPPSYVNSMQRISSILQNSMLSNEEKNNMGKSLLNLLERVIKFKTDVYNEQISKLNAQKNRETNETLVRMNLAREELYGNVFTQQMAKTDLEKCLTNKKQNEEIINQIRKINAKKPLLMRCKTLFLKAWLQKI